MKIRNIYKYMLVVAIGAFGVTACESDKGEVNNIEVTFELLDEDGAALSETQEFSFGTPVTYVLNSKHVAIKSIDVPLGWRVDADIKGRECKITPPNAAGEDVELIGDIVLNLESYQDKLNEYRLNVVIKENPLVFGFDAPTEVVKFGKSLTRKYEFTGSGSFSDIEIGVPSGWSADHTKGTYFFTIVAPATFTSGDESEVSVTPVSALGKKGTPVTFKVQLIDTSSPTVTPGKENASFKFGTAQEVSFTHQGATNIVVVDKPEGWEASVNLSGGKITITPPADTESKPALKGKIAFKAYETAEIEEIALAFEIDVRLDGIIDMEDMAALRADYIKFLNGEIGDSDLDKYMQSSEITLLANVGPLTEDSYITGHSSNTESSMSTFSHVFNGMGNTITLDLTSDKYKSAGLFQNLSSTAHIKNLTVDGSYKATTTGGNSGVFGGIAIRSVGARFTNVTTDIAFVYDPPQAQYSNQHKMGGFVGTCNETASYFTDCVSKGSINMNQDGVLKHVGNIVGYVHNDQKATVVMDKCTNTGDINGFVEIGYTMGNNRYIGGLIGGAEDATTTITNCRNSGNITITADGREIRGHFGGIIGVTAGTIKGCTNTGSITITGLSRNNIYDRLGGIVGNGRANKAGLALLIEDCVNEGAISGHNYFIGGIIGSVENCRSAIIKGCTNKGTLTTFGDIGPYCFGGIAGVFKGDRIENCVNEGEMKGNVSGGAGGVTGHANKGYTGSQSNPGVIKDCTNKGTLNLTTTLTEKNANGHYLPVVAGVAVIGEPTSTNEAALKIYYTLDNCVNSAAVGVKNINTQVTKAGCTQNIWAFALKQRAEDPSTVNDMDYLTIDAASQAAQADRSHINEIVKVKE